MMYIVRNKITGEYWTGAWEKHTPNYYTNNLQKAYVFQYGALPEIDDNEERVEVEIHFKKDNA